MVLFLLLIFTVGTLFAAETKIVENGEFKVSLSVPEGWKESSEKDDDGILLDIQEPEGNAGVSLLCIHMGEKVELDDFIDALEGELESEEDMGKEIPLAFPGKLPSRLSWKQFEAEYMGFTITTLLGYTVRDEDGFVLIGSFALEDEENKTSVLDALNSFRRE